MATQLDEVSQEVSAQMVGNAFVNQFYSFWHENPEVVHNFFQDSSLMTRPGSDGTMTTVTTMKGINDLILSFNCKNYKPQIFSADAHSSHMNGVTVLVTGCLTGNDNVSRKFTETFFLAPQDNGYFVLNNVFRFFDDDNSPMVNPVVKEHDTNVSAEPVTTSQGTVEVHDNSFGNHITGTKETTTESKMEASDPSQQKAATVVETAVVQPPVESSRSAQAVVEASPKPVVEASSNGHVDASKKSYASLLRGMKDGAAATLARSPTPAAKSATANSAQTSVTSSAGHHSSVEATTPATASESSAAPNGRNNNTSSTDQTGDLGYSIYIGDLPWNATIELVEQEFKKFGPIKRNGIQVRSNKGYCVGFVEYEDATAQQKAIKMGTIRIDGKEAFIEEKKTTTRVVNGVSTYSGRGGFRNDGGGYRGRGQGNYSNGRGGGGGYNNVRNEYNNNNRRNGEVSSRGYYSRNGPGSYQNGGRGARPVDNKQF